MTELGIESLSALVAFLPNWVLARLFLGNAMFAMPGWFTHLSIACITHYDILPSPGTSRSEHKCTNGDSSQARDFLMRPGTNKQEITNLVREAPRSELDALAVSCPAGAYESVT